MGVQCEIYLIWNRKEVVGKAILRLQNYEIYMCSENFMNNIQNLHVCLYQVAETVIGSLFLITLKINGKHFDDHDLQYTLISTISCYPQN